LKILILGKFNFSLVEKGEWGVSATIEALMRYQRSWSYGPFVEHINQGSPNYGRNRTREVISSLMKK